MLRRNCQLSCEHMIDSSQLPKQIDITAVHQSSVAAEQQRQEQYRQLQKQRLRDGGWDDE
jgi:hypothetical protein